MRNLILIMVLFISTAVFSNTPERCYTDPHVEGSFIAISKHLRGCEMFPTDSPNVYIITKYGVRVGKLTWNDNGIATPSWYYGLDGGTTTEMLLYFSRPKEMAYKEGSLRKFNRLVNDTLKAAYVENDVIYDGIPGMVTLNQDGIESGFGVSWKAKNLNNRFGIKCHSAGHTRQFHKDQYRRKKTLGRDILWLNDCVNYGKDDHVYDFFKRYDSLEEGLKDHSNLIRRNKRYKWFRDIPFNQEVTTRKLKVHRNYTHVNWMGTKLKNNQVYSFTNEQWWFIGLCAAGYATDRDYAMKGYLRYKCYYPDHIWDDNAHLIEQQRLLEMLGYKNKLNQQEWDELFLESSETNFAYIPIIVFAVLLIIGTLVQGRITPQWVLSFYALGGTAGVLIYKKYLSLVEELKQSRIDKFIYKYLQISNRRKASILFNELSEFIHNSKLPIPPPYVVPMKNTYHAKYAVNPVFTKLYTDRGIPAKYHLDTKVAYTPLLGVEVQAEDIKFACEVMLQSLAKEGIAFASYVTDSDDSLIRTAAEVKYHDKSLIYLIKK